jgi:hypothetical protein
MLQTRNLDKIHFFKSIFLTKNVFFEKNLINAFLYVWECPNMKKLIFNYFVMIYHCTVRCKAIIDILVPKNTTLRNDAKKVPNWHIGRNKKLLDNYKNDYRSC